MRKKLIALTAAVAVTGLVSSSSAFARDQIDVVGSSTVFPFATAVAENFGSKGKFKTPKVESTGSGGGLKLFCAKGNKTPYIINASRRIRVCGNQGHAVSSYWFRQFVQSAIRTLKLYLLSLMNLLELLHSLAYHAVTLLNFLDCVLFIKLALTL